MSAAVEHTESAAEAAHDSHGHGHDGHVPTDGYFIKIAIILAVEMKGLLIGEAASDEDLAAIETSINGAPKVNGLIHLRTMHLSPDQLLVAAKVEYDRSLNVDELARAIDDTEVQMRAAVPIAHIVYIEPDIRRKPAE